MRNRIHKHTHSERLKNEEISYELFLELKMGYEEKRREIKLNWTRVPKGCRTWKNA
jgi:hypothetical protein